ncbi:pilus assembly protein [Pseudomonas sp.]|uniref:pilus assembly protein n=1 Tax=Pseudomonas sp. TaxID=306 RepID=UPI0027296650|nr:PilC/PilY family type IV pilus protein [Pseudomonas sp.]
MSTVRPERGVLGRLQFAPVLSGVAVVLASTQMAQAFTPRPGAMLAGTAVAPNMVILFDNSSSMRRDLDGAITSDDSRRRITIAKTVLKNVLADNRGLRYGLFVYNGSISESDGPGGRKLLGVASVAPGEGDAHFASLSRQIAAIEPSVRPATYTPLGETYYEITRYMRGLTPHYQGSGVTTFTSPIEYRCQRNFALVLTDGLPTADFDRPSELPPASDPDRNNPGVAGENNLPNWRGSSAPFHLAELAAFANETDLRNTRRHGVRNDAAGKSWDDPDYPMQSMQTHVIGFGFGAGLDDEEQPDAGANPLAAAAQAGGGQYFAADSADQLSAALRKVVGEINATAGSGGSGTASSPVLMPGESLFYRTRYDPEDWSGSIEAVQLGALGQLEARVWTTDSTYVPGNRRVETINEFSGMRVVIGKESATRLAAPQVARLASEARRAGAVGDDLSAANVLLDWVRGNNPAPLRRRHRLMGDVINSPIRHTVQDTESAGDGSAAFEAFRLARLVEMTPSLVIGSNDGLLHVLDANTGEHRMGYLPVSAYGFLGSKASSQYGGATYTPGVDGPIALADVRIGGLWTTLAVAGMGAGGKSLIGLRLFDEASGNTALGALWERNPSHANWSNLGFTYAMPAFGRMADGRSVVVVGNGYGSASGKASLIVADAATGEVIRELMVPDRHGVPGNNGLSSARLVTDSRGVLHTAYAGDLHGQLWRFDLAGSEVSGWSLAFDAQPLFRTEDDQPITVQPQIAEHPQGGRMVLFGTGKLLEQTDISSTALQAFYGVWDRPGGSGGLGAGDLRAQRIAAEKMVNGRANRVVTQYPVSWSTESGWYLPLSFNGSRTGERVTRNLLVRGNRVLFNTGLVDATNSKDPCEGLSGDGWLMALDLLSGSMMAYGVLDIGGDGVVSEADGLSAGIDLNVGWPGDITVVTGDGVEHYVVGGSAGTETLTGLSLSLFRRVMWRQLM